MESIASPWLMHGVYEKHEPKAVTQFENASSAAAVCTSQLITVQHYAAMYMYALHG